MRFAKLLAAAALIYAVLMLAFGIFCLVQGNPAWLVAHGFTNWALPLISILLGLKIGVLAIHANHRVERPRPNNGLGR